MGLIKQNISNLVGGVSQQAQTLRRSNQASAVDNAVSSLVDGLKKRPGASFVSKLMASPTVRPFVHLIERDKSERYAVIIANGSIRVFDAETGAERSVSYANGATYIDVPNPAVALKAITIEDYTFIVNTAQTVEATSQPFKETDKLTATVAFNLPSPASYAFASDPNANSGTGGELFKPLPADSTTTLETNFSFGGMGDSGPLNANLGYVSDLNRYGSSMEAFPSQPYATLGQALEAHRGYLQGIHGKAMTLQMGAAQDIQGTRYHSYYFTYDQGREPGAVFVPPSQPIQFKVQTSGGTYSQWFSTLAEAQAFFVAQGKANYGDPMVFNYNGTQYFLEVHFGNTYSENGIGQVTIPAWLQMGNKTSDNTPGPMTGQWAPNSWPLGILMSNNPSCASGYTYDLAMNACVKTGQTTGTGMYYMRGELTTQGVFNYYLLGTGTPYRPGYTTNGQSIDPAKQAVGASEVILTVNDQVLRTDLRSDKTNEDYATYFYTHLSASPGLYGIEDITRSSNSLVLTPIAGGRLDVSCNVSYVSVQKGYPTLEDALFVYVKNGVAEQTYRLSIGGNATSFTTGNTNETATYKSENIAEELGNAIALWGGFQVQRFGSLLMVKRTDGGSLNFDYSDTWGNQALYVMRNRVRTFSDLPERFVEGTVIEVAGDNETGGYYVHYVTGSSQHDATQKTGLDGQLADESIGSQYVASGTSQQVIDHGGWKALEGQESGYWEECAYPRARSTLVPSSMPHALIRKADGSFVFKAINWARRGSGDEILTPSPSFVGRSVHDVFLFRNRLGFLTRDSVVMSNAGDYFNFWPTSAKQVLDDDPIDFQVGSAKVATLRNTATFNSTMLLFADSMQFVVTAQGALTPKTLVVQPSTEFETDPMVKPVSSGRTLFFSARRGKFSALYEYDVLPDRFQSSASEVTSHVPKYVPQDVRQLSVSINEDILTVLTDAEPTALYVLKYLWKDNAKVQEAWGRWVFPFAIVGQGFTASRLNLIGDFDGSLCLFHVNTQLGVTEGDMVADALLDAKVSPQGTFDGSFTRWALPYSSNTGAVQALATEGYGPGGQPVQLQVVSPGVVKAAGDWTSAGVKLGLPYGMVYEFSQLYPRDQNDMPRPGYVLQLRGLDVNYHNGYKFSVEVTPLHRPAIRYDYPRTDYQDFVEIQKEVGVFRVPVLAKAHQVSIKLINDTPQQASIDTVQWSASAVSR